MPKFISIVRITFCVMLFAAIPASSVSVKAQSGSGQGMQPSPARERKPPQKEDALKDFLPREASVRYPPRAQMRGGIERSINTNLSKAETDYRAGRNAAAVPEAKQAVKEQPDSYESHYLLALTLTETGDLKEAIEEFKKALALATKDDSKIVTNYNMGNAYFDTGDYQDAAATYQNALKVDATLSKPHNNLGLAYVALGRLDEAMEEFNRAVNLKHEYADAHFNLGVAYLKLGRKSDAEAQQQVLAELKSELAVQLSALLNK